MIIDLDAHQGNGHEKDFLADSMECCLAFIICSSRALLYCSSLCRPPSLWIFIWFGAGRVYILDMYNPDIYPLVGYLMIYLLKYSLLYFHSCHLFVPSPPFTPSYFCSFRFIFRFNVTLAETSPLLMNIIIFFSLCMKDYEARRYITQKVEVAVRMIMYMR